MDPNLLITLAILGLQRAGEIGALIDRARTEKRDVTQAELDMLFAQDDAVREQLRQAINAAKPQGQ